MSESHPEPVWREFTLFNDTMGRPLRKLRIDVRHVHSITTDTGHILFGGFAEIAIIEMSDGTVYRVEDYGRHVAHDCDLSEPPKADRLAALERENARLRETLTDARNAVLREGMARDRLHERNARLRAALEKVSEMPHFDWMAASEKCAKCVAKAALAADAPAEPQRG